MVNTWHIVLAFEKTWFYQRSSAVAALITMKIALINWKCLWRNGKLLLLSTESLQQGGLEYNAVLCQLDVGNGKTPSCFMKCEEFYSCYSRTYNYHFRLFLWYGHLLKGGKPLSFQQELFNNSCEINMEFLSCCLLFISIKHCSHPGRQS